MKKISLLLVLVMMSIGIQAHEGIPHLSEEEVLNLEQDLGVYGGTWVCYARNLSGEPYRGEARSREDAAFRALKKCERKSLRCHLVGCQRD